MAQWYRHFIFVSILTHLADPQAIRALQRLESRCHILSHIGYLDPVSKHLGRGKQATTSAGSVCIDYFQFTKFIL
jgi:hypothetical protein